MSNLDKSESKKEIDHKRDDNETGTSKSKADANTSSDIGTPPSRNDGVEEYQWRTWDFVPDGLLVWEAWVHWMANEKR